MRPYKVEFGLSNIIWVTGGLYQVITPTKVIVKLYQLITPVTVKLVQTITLVICQLYQVIIRITGILINDFIKYPTSVFINLPTENQE